MRDRTCAAVRESRSILLAGHPSQAVDAIVQLSFSQVELLARAILVDPAFAHRYRDLIHIANLRQHVVGQPAKLQEPPLLGEGATVAAAELLGVQPSREVQYFVWRATRNGRAIRK